ncbi:hypothetical protein, partial [Burkholderia sp. RF2-non_BP3]|uniref:hypothetical protein n=1 Tax=Burkholderia sp. RF2-non_BP3 TaxID=1637844 RepID=UPI001C54FC57
LKSISARNLEFLSSAAFSAAEKRDYEPSFSARQQLSELLRCDDRGSTSCAPGFYHRPRPHRSPFPPAPRFRERERGVILSSSRRSRKGFLEKI